MSNVPDWQGRYPYPKDKKRPCVQKQNELLKFLYTETAPETSDLNWVIASTDSMTVGEYQLSPGSHFSPADVHAGDEIYYVLRGEVTMLQPETGQVLRIRKNEGILMPKGTPHIGYNFGETEARMLYVLAPKAWDESAGIPLEFNGIKKLYKFEERSKRL